MAIVRSFRHGNGSHASASALVASGGNNTEATMGSVYARLGSKVSVVEPTGSETLVFGHLGGTLICVQFNERFRTRPGEELPLDVDVDQVHVFGAVSRRL